MTTPAAAPRRVNLFDGFDEERNRPIVNRAQLMDGEAPRVLAYLNAGPVILFASALSEDAYFPQNPPAVPMKFSTDGTWIWPGAVAYYLEKYGMPPEREFLDHIRGRDYQPPEVSDEALEAARVLMTSGP